MLVEIKVMGKHLIRVRRARTKNDSVRFWDGVFRGQTDRITGLEWDELKMLTEGFHEFADPPKRVSPFKTPSRSPMRS